MGKSLHRILVGLALLLVLIASSGAWAQPKDGTVFKDWTVRCDSSPENKAAGGCFMFQNVVNKESQRPVMQVAIGYLTSEKIPAAVVTLPLGVRLPPGVTLKVDQNPGLALPFERCTPDGCKVQFKLDEAQVAAFKAGAVGNISFQRTTGGTIVIPFSLQGFTAALGSLK